MTAASDCRPLRLPSAMTYRFPEVVGTGIAPLGGHYLNIDFSFPTNLAPIPPPTMGDGRLSTCRKNKLQ